MGNVGYMPQNHRFRQQKCLTYSSLCCKKLAGQSARRIRLKSSLCDLPQWCKYNIIFLNLYLLFQKIANQNLKAGVYFVVVDGETVKVVVN